MKHLFKVPLNLADLFIEKVTEEEITYSVRTKDTGELMEPRRTTKYLINEQTKRVHFDMREVPVEMLQLIYQVLL